MTETIYSAERALELLRLGSGQVHASFRDGQEEAIQQITDGDHRLLVVQKTGWVRVFLFHFYQNIEGGWMWSSFVGFSIARTNAEPDSCRRADGGSSRHNQF